MFLNAWFLSRNLTQMIAHAELKKRFLGFNIPSKTIYIATFLSTYKYLGKLIKKDSDTYITLTR